MQWGGSDAFCAKNSDATSWHKILHYFGPFCTEFRKATKRSRMHPKLYKMHKNISLGSNGVDRVCSVRKIPTRLYSRTFALVRPVLHRFSLGNQMVQNPPKLYESHQNISLGSNGVDRARSLRKIPTRLHSRTFALVRPVLHQDSYGNQTVKNAPK